MAARSLDKLQFEAVVHMKGASVLNDQYPFGVGVEIDGSEVWVATLNVTAALEDPVSVCYSCFSIIVHGGQLFMCWNLEYPEKTTDLQ
jgi:hypothetical protein